jgi:uncharacterized protein (DUF433 family)
MEPAIKHRYIVRDDRILGGEPIVEGTRTPVRAVAELWRLGLQPDEIVRRLPHLTLAQAFDALSYYSDHRDEINAFIERNRIGEEETDPLVRGA